MTSEPSPLSRRAVVLLASLLGAVALIFSGTLTGDFVYRDQAALAEREAIRIPGHWTELLTQPESFASDSGGSPASQRGVWRPLTALFQAALWRAGDGAAFPYRLASLAAHLLATGLAFGLARRLLGSTSLALAASALFALRPSAVEALAQASALAEPLHAGLALLAAWAFLEARSGGRRGAWILALTAFALALLAKETALFILLALPFARPAGASDEPELPRFKLRALAPLAAIAGVWFAARWMFLGGLSGGGFSTSTADYGLEPARSLLLRFELLAFAAPHALLPFDSALLRPVDPYLSLSEFALGRRFVGLSAILVLAGLVIRRRNPAALFGAMWLLAGTLPIVLFPTALGQHPFRDQAVYLASFGGALLLAAALRWLAKLFRMGEVPVLVAAGALAAFFGFRSFARIPVWDDDPALFSAARAETPEAIAVQLALGKLYLADYGKSGSGPDLGRAQAAFGRAQDLASKAQFRGEADLVTRDDVLQANLGLGRTLMLQSELDGFGDYADVIDLFGQVAESRPDRVEPQIGLGQAWLAAGDASKSIAALRKAIEIAPKDPRPHSDLGKVLYKVGELDEARRHLEFAHENRPTSSADALWLARTWLDLRKPALARSSAEAALALEPENAEAKLLLGQIQLREGRPGAAVNIFDEVLAIEPKLALAHTERGKALLALGSGDEALLAWRRACDFGTHLFEPHYLVAAHLTQRELFDPARPYVLRAYELCADLGLREQLRGLLASGLVQEPATWVALARVDRQRGDLRSARDFAERALGAPEPSAEALAERGRIELAAGLPVDALPFLERARDLAPERFDLARDLGFARAEMGDEPGARAELERALQLVPDESTREALRTSLEAELRASLRGIPAGPVAPVESGSASPQED